MALNRYTSPDTNQATESQDSKRARAFGNRLLIALLAFLSAVGAFYFSLAVNIFGSPYMHEHITLGYFLNWLWWALIFAAICTLIVSAASFLIVRIELKHFFALLIPIGIELAVTYLFFVAFFGV